MTVATHVATGLSYEDAYQLVRAVGFAGRTGRIRGAYAFAQYGGWKPLLTDGAKKYGTFGTLGQFVKKHQTGTFVIQTRGHWTAVKDGNTYDNSSRPSLKAQVLQVWSV